MKLIVLVAPILVAGCSGGPCSGPENQLVGSVSESYDIAVDSVRARLSESDMTVTVDFKHGNDSVAKVIANVDRFKKGSTIPLVDGTVRRVTSPDTQYPRDIVRGEVLIESNLSVGGMINGCFNVLFSMPDNTQRTLEGVFATTLEKGL